MVQDAAPLECGGLLGYREKIFNPITRELPRAWDLFDGASSVRASRPLMSLVKDGIPSAIRGITEALRNFSWSCYVNTRHLFDGNALELNKAQHCSGLMSLEPQLDSVMVVGLPLPKKALAQAPASILTSFDGNFEQLVTLGDDEVVLGLVRAVLNRHIIAAPRKQRGGN
jgi:hypothetical protein